MNKNGVLCIGKLLGCAVCAVTIAFSMLPQVTALKKLPDEIYIDNEKDISLFQSITAPFELTADEGVEVDALFSQTLKDVGAQSADVPGRAHISVELFGVKLREITLLSRKAVYLMPGGEAVGISLHTDGAVVVGMGKIAHDGDMVSPAADAGVQPGDIIIEMNGVNVDTGEEKARISSECMLEGEKVTLKLLRDGKSKSVDIEPVRDLADGVARLGMWVRDSTIGIGTLTFMELDGTGYGALGHAITDQDTGTVLPVLKGEIVKAEIAGISIGMQGTPGELRGTFSRNSQKLGDIYNNTAVGIFGTMNGEYENPLYKSGVELAYPDEAVLGLAKLLTSIDNEGVKEYDCEIIRLFSQGEAGARTKGMVIKVTDPALIAKTGGIVQGMSGSPLMQNGKLIGAVTHVFINDPLKGYCVYAVWMLEQLGIR